MSKMIQLPFNKKELLTQSTKSKTAKVIIIRKPINQIMEQKKKGI